MNHSIQLKTVLSEAGGLPEQQLALFALLNLGCVGVSALLEAASSAREISPGISDELLDRARNEARAAVNEARLAVWNLRQGAGEGLVTAVSQLARRTERETGIPVKFESSGVPLALGSEGEGSLS